MRNKHQKAFYSSKIWERCRQAYISQAKGLCEECLKNGKITPGEHVHHKIPLTPETVDDPELALNFDNLELLCRDCHAAEHRKYERPARYKVDEFGRAIVES